MPTIQPCTHASAFDPSGVRFMHNNAVWRKNQRARKRVLMQAHIIYFGLLSNERTNDGRLCVWMHAGNVSDFCCAVRQYYFYHSYFFHTHTHTNTHEHTPPNIHISMERFFARSFSAQAFAESFFMADSMAHWLLHRRCCCCCFFSIFFFFVRFFFLISGFRVALTVLTECMVSFFLSLSSTLLHFHSFHCNTYF